MEREKIRRLIELRGINEHENDRIPSMNLTNIEEYQLYQRKNRTNFEDNEEDSDKYEERGGSLTNRSKKRNILVGYDTLRGSKNP